MFSANRAHHARKREHKFENEQKVNNKNRADDYYSYNKGYKKGFQDGRQKGIQEGIQKERERFQREDQERRKKKRRERFKDSVQVLMIFLLVIVIAACLSFYIEKVFLGIITISTGLFTISIINPLKESIKSYESVPYDIQADNSILTRVLAGGREIFKNVIKNGKSLFLLMLSCSILLGGLIGKYEVQARFVTGSEAFVDAFFHYENHTMKKTSDLSENEISGSQEQVGQMELPDITDQKSNLDDVSGSGSVETTDMLDVLLEETDISEDELSMVEISDSEIEQELGLPVEEYNLAFFREGEYSFTDEDDQQKINNNVQQFVQDVRSEKLVSSFDQTAPQDIKDEIANLSKREEAASSFSEIQTINSVRKKTYEDYPKRSFTNLISNSEQKQALVLVFYKGQQKTIMYHYVQSILWNMEFLKYAGNTKSDVEERLSLIAKRYEDIAFVCTECKEREYATKLQKAFEYAAGQY